MKRWLYFIGIVATISFVAGLGWSLLREKQLILKRLKGPPLRILCQENWLSEREINSLAIQKSLVIEYWTYANPSEFLRQMANADGKIDVICVSSLLVRSLVASHWLKKLPFLSLPNTTHLAVDFLHLPFDPENNFTIPLLWNLVGLIGMASDPKLPLRQWLQTQRAAWWADELSILVNLHRLGLEVENRLESVDSQRLDKDLVQELRRATRYLTPSNFAEELSHASASSWWQVPLTVASPWMNSHPNFHFYLPSDGGVLEVGVLAVGERSEHPDKALDFINDLLGSHWFEKESSSAQQFGDTHNDNFVKMSLPSWRRAGQIRQFPLQGLLFPDLGTEALPHLHKVVIDYLGSKSGE